MESSERTLPRGGRDLPGSVVLGPSSAALCNVLSNFFTPQFSTDLALGVHFLAYYKHLKERSLSHFLGGVPYSL